MDLYVSLSNIAERNSHVFRIFIMPSRSKKFLKRIFLMASAALIYYKVVTYVGLVQFSVSPYNINASAIISNATTNYSMNSALDSALSARVAERFLQRSAILKENCRFLKYGTLKINTKSLSKFYHSSRYNFSVCVAAEIASNLWQTLMHNPKTPQTRLTTLLSQMNAPWNTKVFTVRNPLSRLVSGYKSEILSGKKTKEKLPSVLFKYLDKKTLKSLQIENFNDMPFEQYLDQIFSPKKGDPNFRPVHLGCLPCYFKYKYILHFETLDEDLEYLFKKLNVKGATESLIANLGINSTIEDSFYLYFNNLSKDYLKKVYDYVKMDFILFGYRLPDMFKEFIKSKT